MHANKDNIDTTKKAREIWRDLERVYIFFLSFKMVAFISDSISFCRVCTYTLLDIKVPGDTIK